MLLWRQKFVREFLQRGIKSLSCKSPFHPNFIYPSLLIIAQVCWLGNKSLTHGICSLIFLLANVDIFFYEWGNKVVSTGKKKHQAMLLGGLYFCVHWYSNFLLAKGDWGKEANLKLRGVGRVCYLKSSFSVIMYWSLRWLVEVSYPDLCDFLW